MPTPVDQLQARPYDNAALAGWLKKQGFRSIATRLGLDGEMPAAPIATTTVEAAPRRGQAALPLPEAERPALADVASGFGPYVTITTEAALVEFLAETATCGFLAIDTETDGLDPMRAPLVGLSLAVALGRAAYMPLRHEGLAEQVSLAAAIVALGPVLSDPAVLKIYQNAKFDMLVMERAGFPRAAPFDDTMLVSYAQEGGMHGHGLDELAQLHLGHTPISYDEVTGTGRNRVPFSQVPIERAASYAAEDVDVALRVWQALRPRLRFNGALALYEQLERRLVPVLLEMERAGIKVDADDLRRMSLDFEQRMGVIERDIHRLTGREFNVGSPSSSARCCSTSMKLPWRQADEDRRLGYRCRGAADAGRAGARIAGANDGLAAASKLKSTYADALVEQINPDTGRVHTSFAHGDRVHRAAVVHRSQFAEHPDPHRGRQPHPPRLHRRTGTCAGTADYSQIELRLLAHVADIPALTREFRPRRGHPRAHRIGSVRHSDGGDGPDDAPARQGDQFRHHLRHQRLWPGASARHHARRGACLHRRAISSAIPASASTWSAPRRRRGSTAMCRRRSAAAAGCPASPTRTRRARGYAERQAINAPLQGGAADIIKRAMVRLPKALQQAGLRARLLLQVHDELLFEAPEAEVASLTELARRVMECAAVLSVPLVVETGSGRTWADAH